MDMGISHFANGLALRMGHLPSLACLDNFGKYSLRDYKLIYDYIELILPRITSYQELRTLMLRDRVTPLLYYCICCLTIWNLEGCYFYGYCILYEIYTPLNGFVRIYVRGITENSIYVN